jgi:hypothetical protein
MLYVKMNLVDDLTDVFLHLSHQVAANQHLIPPTQKCQLPFLVVPAPPFINSPKKEMFL